jgi:glyoxylase-like metal-dependent hydrolase (beta-lactamase superfamily II)
MDRKLSRRALFKAGGTLALGLGVASTPLIAKAQTGPLTPPDIYRFKLGSKQMTVISDGYLDVPTEFFVGAPPSLIQGFLDRHYMPTDAIHVSMNVLLMEDNNGLTLFDTGAGAWSLGGDPTGGRLVHGLKYMGIEPEDINNVVITHAHPDHLGAYTLDMQTPTFPNAVHWISRDEWDFWTDLPERTGPFDQDFAPFIQANLFAVESLAELYIGNPTLWDGVSMVEAPGHTLAHKAILIESDGEQLMISGDSVPMPTMSLKQPDWTLVVEYDQAESINSRKRLLRNASNGRILMHSFHAPFPGLGYIKGSTLINNYWDWIQTW